MSRGSVVYKSVFRISNKASTSASVVCQAGTKRMQLRLSSTGPQISKEIYCCSRSITALGTMGVSAVGVIVSKKEHLNASLGKSANIIA